MTSQTSHGLILYGPPASGKDTITRELHRQETRFDLFPRLKVGKGRTNGYRIITAAELEHLVESGDIAWVNHRYQATYAVDISGLQNCLRTSVSVLHLGQVEAVEAISTATPATRWTIVELWCPRSVAEQRLIGRDPSDVDARLAAWDATDPLPRADQRIDTSSVSAEHAARLIIEGMRSVTL